MHKIQLPFKTKEPILACGADLKGAFALAKGREAFFVDDFGDLGDVDNLTRYEKAVKRYEKILGIRPKRIVCDLHPGYFSTRFAENSQLTTHNSQLYKVQHHEAHIASAIVDNSISGDVIGVAFDGTGFGLDGNIWGGEFLVGNLKGFKRVAHLKYMPMPGGEMAIREPWRMATSYLYRAFGDKFLGLRLGFVRRLNKKDWSILEKMIDNDINSPLTSSMGRLFDAVGSITLLKKKISFEAELPIELEKIAFTSCQGFYDFEVKTKDGILIPEPSGIIRGIIKDLFKNIDTSIISSKFHNTVANMISKVSLVLKRRFGIEKVVLSGGVFQNRYLVDKTVNMLKEGDFTVFVHSRIPTNDSGIPIGQVAIANVRHLCA